MTPERWERVGILYREALERASGERADFLRQACGSDHDLRGEVESLLAAGAGAGSFLSAGAMEDAARMLAGEQDRTLVGQVLGRYRVLALLGRGGMGEVYLAEDTRLGRRVALKLLPAELAASGDRVRRFEREARAVAALSHPNVCVIHEVVEAAGSLHYIVMEYVEGETLRARMGGGRMPVPEAIDVAAQIASALSAAHEAGVVHRDIKPENVMLRPDGYVKVLDFGLAKLTERAGPTAAGTLQPGTQPGVLMGTVAYMSPEQARGAEVDARTDVWSLGVVLYEMLAGRAPFEGATPSHVTVSILESEPPPLARYAEVPAEAERIVRKALRKEKRERYQTASDLALDLKSLRQELEVEARLKRFSQPLAGSKEVAAEGDGMAAAAGESAAHSVSAAPARPTSGAGYLVAGIKRRRRAAALAAAALVSVVATVVYLAFFRARGGNGEAIDSVAVLPFVNVGNDSDTEYLSDGISDSIINNLSRLPNLRVISLNSVLRYKGKQVDPQAVGRELNVRAVLTGRLVRRGDDLTISTELIDLRDNRRLWGDQYNRKLSDILVVQDDIARQIAAGLRPRLTGEEEQRLAKRYTDNARAYELYALGMYHLRKQTKEDINKSLEFFEQAVKLDPNYALAYTGLVRSYFALGQRGIWLPKEARQKMEWAAQKAVEIDDMLPDAHALLGVVKKSSWDWAGAEREFKRALELDPNSEGGLFLYTVHLIHIGRTDEALVYAKRHEEVIGGVLMPAFVYLYAHEYDKAIELYLKLGQNSPGRNQLTECYLGKGMYEEAINVQKVVARANAPELWNGYPILAYAYAAAGRRPEALKILAEQQELAKRGYISPFNFAIIYTGLGDKDRAFEYLNKAYEEGSQVLPHFPKRPLFDSLHADPRYAELLRKMNYPL